MNKYGENATQFQVDNGVKETHTQRENRQDKNNQVKLEIARGTDKMGKVEYR